jgi:copper transport protein
MVTDVTHVWAAAAWFGIVLLAIVLWRRRDDDPLVVGRMVARFSRIATLAVVVVAVAGGVLAYEEVRAARALTSTTYGWVLIAKVAAVAVVAAIGAYNHLRLVPALEQAPRAATRLLRRTVRAEAFVMLVVVALASVLVAVTPARTAAGITGIFSDTKPLGNGSVNLVVDPDRAGPNSIHLYVLDAAGRNVDVMSVELDASLPSSGIAAITLTPFAAGPGHYQVDGAPLTIAGSWTIEVKARVSKFEEQTATFTVSVHT